MRQRFVQQALRGQGFSQDQGRFDPAGPLSQDFVALGNCFTILSVRQQGLGQAQVCSQMVGIQENDLPPLGDGSTVVVAAGQCGGQPFMIDRRGRHETDRLFIVRQRFVDFPLFS